MQDTTRSTSDSTSHASDEGSGTSKELSNWSLALFSLSRVAFMTASIGLEVVVLTFETSTASSGCHTFGTQLLYPLSCSQVLASEVNWAGRLRHAVLADVHARFSGAFATRETG